MFVGRLYSQTLGKAGKACLGKNTSLLRTFVIYGRKMFYNILSRKKRDLSADFEMPGKSAPVNYICRTERSIS